MKDFTPSIEALRTHYEWGGAVRQDPRQFDRAIAKLQSDAVADHIARQHLPTVQVEFTNQPEFDRVIREAQADALMALADKMRDRFTAIWVRQQARAIRNETPTEETPNV